MAQQPERLYQPLVRTQLEVDFCRLPEKRRAESAEDPNPSKRRRISTGPHPHQVEEVKEVKEVEEVKEVQKAADSSEAREDSGLPGSSARSPDSSSASRGSTSGCSSPGGGESSSSSSSTGDFEARYEELQLLGSGGLGQVFAGYRREDRLPTLNGEQTDIPLEVHLMQSVGGCEGPGAPVLLLDWFHLGQELVLVQERPVPFVDLLTYMQSKEDPLQEQEAKMILRQVIQGILGLHSSGVLHRDIKAENILVETGSDTPRIRIIDLGCGCLLHGGVYSEMSGTSSHTPPEWYKRGSYRAGPLTVWQVGVLLYNMLVGHCPFQTQTEIIQKKLQPIQRELSSSCQHFLKRCLTKPPLGRPPLEHLLLHPWLRPLSSE
ncbi:hypothetical protein CRUP_011514 [Coryphaenoides rupestris]|nr:hypothetical protein CRUP_011514 [Coryphaenoides rupestris]